jgi:hypothetical protein
MKRISIFLKLLFIGLVFVGCNSQKDLNSNSDINTTDFTKEYTINNSEFGTKTSMTISNDKRILKTNSLPNHKTGSFPNEGNPNTISIQNLEYSFPINPVLTGTSKWAREFGIAVNGIKFEPETAERFECETGEVCTYSNPMQSTTKILENTNPDGIFVSDWEYVAGSGDLDECNGTMLDGKYVYFATFSYPYVGRCLKGVFKEKRPNGPPPGGNGNRLPPRN